MEQTFLEYGKLGFLPMCRDLDVNLEMISQLRRKIVHLMKSKYILITLFYFKLKGACTLILDLRVPCHIEPFLVSSPVSVQFSFSLMF